jgi:hypothetical protein
MSSMGVAPSNLIVDVSEEKIDDCSMKFMPAI